MRALKKSSFVITQIIKAPACRQAGITQIEARRKNLCNLLIICVIKDYPFSNKLGIVLKYLLDKGLVGCYIYSNDMWTFKLVPARLVRLRR